jgi:hypothetical protein
LTWRATVCASSTASIARIRSSESAGSATATDPTSLRSRTAEPTARRSFSWSMSVASPRPTSTTTGALVAPPPGSLVTSPAEPLTPSDFSVDANDLPSADATSSPPGATSTELPLLTTPTTTASALVLWGAALLRLIFVTAVPRRRGWGSAAARGRC